MPGHRAKHKKNSEREKPVVMVNDKEAGPERPCQDGND